MVTINLHGWEDSEMFLMVVRLRCVLTETEIIILVAKKGRGICGYKVPGQTYQTITKLKENSRTINSISGLPRILYEFFLLEEKLIKL